MNWVRTDYSIFTSTVYFPTPPSFPLPHPLPLPLPTPVLPFLPPLPPQLELEVAAQRRKVTMMTDDLDRAEQRSEELQKKAEAAETQLDEATR